jgi:hypothetical protein
VVDQLEPEFVVAGMPMTGIQLLGWLFIMMLAVRDAALQGQGWLPALLMLPFLLTLLFSSPRVRRLLPGFRAEQFAYIAAPGVVKHHRKGVWKIDDSVMLVGSLGGETLEVQLIGPRQTAFLAFASAEDPDFIALWQRWNHPHPRPELLVEQTSGVSESEAQ